MTIQQYDVLQASARMEMVQADDVVNVWQYQYQDVTPIADAQGISDVITILELFYTILVAAQSVLLVYRDIRFKNITQSQVLGTHPWITMTVGGGAADPTPFGCAGVINWTTLKPRIGMRKFMGVYTEANVTTGGVYSAALVASMVTAAGPTLAPQAVGGRNYQFGYQSPKTGLFEVPTSFLVTDIPGYQRRRKPGRGA